MKLSSSLPTGQYRATVHLGIWDLAGNPLATPVTWTFRVAGENNRVIERQSIAAGSLFTLALKADHTLWAWGNNDSGQLGVTLPGGNSFDYRTPLQVNQDHNWFSVAAGGSHSAALKTDGSLWGWGLNDQGQLGDSTQETRRLPIQIGTDRDWAMVAVGYDHTLGIKQNHTLWAWGNNGQGKLGDGSEENRLAPIQIGNAPNWFEIGVGRNHTLGLKLDGTLWSWGGNLYGQLGDGTRDSRAVPTQIGSASDWVHVGAAAAGSFSFGLKADGSLWGWGGNGSSGQLGVYRQPGIVNSVADQSSPVPIGSEKSWELDP